MSPTDAREERSPGLRLMELLSPGGAHVTYGAMSRRSLKVPNKFNVIRNVSSLSAH